LQRPCAYAAWCGTLSWMTVSSDKEVATVLHGIDTTTTLPPHD
jgi:hypothetical protein